MSAGERFRAEKASANAVKSGKESGRREAQTPAGLANPDQTGADMAQNTEGQR